MDSLTPASKKFILHWGELGTRWGLSRTVAQIHALLYLSPTPLHAEQISALLSIARSNVSTSLRELQGWGIVRVSHVLGDRRDHFESLKDVWELFHVILEERKRREIDPTLQVLRSCADELENSGPEEAYARERIAEMLTFFEETTELYEEVKKVPSNALRRMVKFRGQVRRLLDS
jgi:DNA-binding transcriptional regulator GbsR (MarR family)